MNNTIWIKRLSCGMLAALMLLGTISCDEEPVSGSVTDAESQNTESTETESNISTENTDTETTEEETTEEETTEEETTAPIQIEVPAYEDAKLYEQMLGEDNRVIPSYTFSQYSLADMRLDSKLVFTTLNGFTPTVDKVGLTTTIDMWNCVGIDECLTGPFTAKATIYNFTGEKADLPMHTIMFGARVQGNSNLHINSGIWFGFADHTVYVVGNRMVGEEKERFCVSLGTDFPFDAKDGVNVEIIDDGINLQVKANDIDVASVEFFSSENKLIVRRADGTEVATSDLTLFAHGDTLGYVRTMAHYTNATVASMSLSSGEIADYQPADTFTELRDGYSYFLRDKTQFKTDLPIIFKDGAILLDAETLAELIGFSCTVTDTTAVLTCDPVTLTFAVGETSADVNGKSYAFPTVVKNGDSILLSADVVLRWLGYFVKVEDDTAYIVADESKLTEQRIGDMNDLYELYRTVVYNYDDVECDRVGMSASAKVDPEDRLVGIAYSTWHRSNRDWGNDTWDVPLAGGYVSNDREVIYRHGIQLRDAGVDFVFVDWSNNTTFDPATMSEIRSDFYMIEKATNLLFEVWSTIEGAPKICLFVGPGHDGQGNINNGNHQKKVDQVYREYVEKYPDLYFEHEGKPLLICYGATPHAYGVTPRWTDDRFTVRWMTGFVGQQTKLFQDTTRRSKGIWSWEERGAQTFTVVGGKVECMTVSAATRGRDPEVEGTGVVASYRNNGETFKRQFQRAMDLGAGIALLTTWNEWSTGEQHSPEDSRDLEPSQIHGTFYYDLMCEQIKKFKGQITVDSQ